MLAACDGRPNLVDRAARIVQAATGAERSVVEQALRDSGERPKVATVMVLAGVEATEAERRLEAAEGSVRSAVGSA